MDNERLSIGAGLTLDDIDILLDLVREARAQAVKAEAPRGIRLQYASLMQKLADMRREL